MKKRLEMLEELQDIDHMIDKLKSVRSGLEAEMSSIRQSVETAREEVAALERAIDDHEVGKRDLETVHAAELLNITRSETNMKEIKTNKEFQAVSREIAAARKQVAEIEDLILLKIKLTEDANAELKAGKERLDELVGNAEQHLADKKTELDRLQADIDADNSTRDNLLKGIPGSLVKKFNILREQRRGQALAIARDGYCVGCNMQLPPQLYNSLFRYEEILSCPHCQRILILKLQQA